MAGISTVAQIIVGSGPPVSGVNGSFAGAISAKDFYFDSAGNALYVNIGSGTRPAWNLFRISGPVISPNTSGGNISSEESGLTFTNDGASGSRTFNLPLIQTGLAYRFVVIVAQDLIVQAQNAQDIKGFGFSGSSISSSALYSTLLIEAFNSSIWVVSESNGTWT